MMTKRNSETTLRREAVSEPLVALVEAGLPVAQWLRLDRAYRRLMAAIGDRLAAVCPLDLGLPAGRALRVEQHGRSGALTLFSGWEACQTWARFPRAVPFVRIWKAGPGELFDEDVAMLERAGLDPWRDGTTVAVRLSDEGLWEDVCGEEIDVAIEACRWAALKIYADGDRAA